MLHRLTRECLGQLTGYLTYNKNNSMKKYPSIILSKDKDFQEEFTAYVFDKLDGSNLRFEWDSKKGWYKFGTRNRLFDESDEVFGIAVSLFMDTLAESIETIARQQKWKGVIAFAEFWGKNSFAGEHDPADQKYLTLFDINPFKKGIIGPEQFLDLFGSLSIPGFLGKIKWTRDFVQTVRAGSVEGITFEGVVGKAGEGHRLIMRKAKTRAWIDKVFEKFGTIEGEKIINS
jgi:hypothetical protein